ncbi:MAG: bacterial transcriptional activator domain-containing protein [Lachnospiraceae bacterium]|nr:bacterial transcriptional activator domain-containing protein [Lachnospiraceae bacterium]
MSEKNKSETEQGKKQLCVNVLGEFAVTFDGKPVSLGKKMTAKYIQMFQILMLNQGHQESKKRLAAMLYPYESLSNQNNSMNNNIYRLRKLFSADGSFQDDCIQVSDGSCQWNEDYPVQVDALLFEHLIQDADKAEGAEKRRLLHQAWKLYSGELLPLNSTEEWVILESISYKKLYTRCVKELLDCLNEEQDYREAYAVATRAAMIYPFEGWQVSQMDSLMALEEYESAYRLYQNTVKMYMEEADMDPSQEMLDRLKNLSTKLQGTHEDLRKIRENLAEVTKKTEAGAYYCAYPGFVDIYRLTRRIAIRNGNSVYLMQCMLVNRQGIPFSDKVARERQDVVKEAIQKTLRGGDAFTLYKDGIFLILLNNTNEENCGRVFQRIIKSYESLGGSRRNLEYRTTSVIEQKEPELLGM